MSDKFQFFVNGNLVEVSNEIPLTLNIAQYIRKELKLTGTKIGCGVGGCGSCTVLISSYDLGTDKIKNYSKNACITPIGQLHGHHILTIEGLSNSTENSCHYLQDAISQGNGTQCGFCTPGMVMSMYSSLNKTPASSTQKKLENASEKSCKVGEIKKAIQGNLCRCTGYRPIVQSFEKCLTAFCGEIEIEDLVDLFHQNQNGTKGGLQEPRKINLKADIDFDKIHKILSEFWSKFENLTTLSTSQGPLVKWPEPRSLLELSRLLKDGQNPAIIAGGTDSKYFRENEKSTIILLRNVVEMKGFEIFEDFVKIGAGESIESLIEHLQSTKTRFESKTRGFDWILDILEKIGSPQIRNSVTIGGSLMTKNGASDLQTLFAGLDWRIKIFDTETGLISESCTLPSENRKLIIVALEIPFISKDQIVWCYKHSKRPENDLAIVNCAYKITLDDSEGKVKVKELKFAFGGLALERFTFEKVYENQGLLSDQFQTEIENSVRNFLAKCLKEDFALNYIKELVQNINTKFFDYLQNGGAKIQSGNDELKASQIFSLKNNQLHDYDTIGQPIPHVSGYKHATGQAVFTDDINKYGELSMSLLISTRACANIVKIDTSQCLNIKGYVGFISREDLPSKERNLFGLVVKDEELFADSMVTHHGQILGAVVAETPEVANSALNLIQVHYGEESKPIITIEDAITAGSFYDDFEMSLNTGESDIDRVFGDPGLNLNVLEGTMRIGSQAHFYLEPQVSIAIPSGDGGDEEMTIISSTQNPTGVQSQVAHVLGVPLNKVIVKVTRVGGGFGGKEARCLLVALPVAIAAKKFGKPVRLVLDRDTDMRISGKRNHFEANYRVGFEPDGKLIGLEMNLFCNAGISLDVSMAAIERALLNIDNAYYIPNIKLNGKVCKTNIPSNTSMRGTGAPQAILIIENILQRIATHLNKDPNEVRSINFYKEKQVTPYGQIIENSNILKCWESCIESSNFTERFEKIKQFNKQNKWIKRGLSIVPMQYGVGFTALHLNQASALVHIYQDGSVIVNQGGVEIGQGLYTKLIQIASRELGISAKSDKIRVIETATDKIINSSPTAASSSTDMSGMAVLVACQRLCERLKPFKELKPNAPFEEIVQDAYLNRVNLSASGFYKIPDMGYSDTKAMKGSPFNYFSTGAACSEVEVDCLTGEFRILRTDIVMDVGQSLNPAIDIGQIEGAFIQGVGFFTSEELIIDSKSGELKTTSPQNYKIPSVSIVPNEFNVTILQGISNPKAIYSSKAIGEPPLLLSSSVFLAIKNTISEFRKCLGSPADFPLDSPVTPEKIILACSTSSS